jgi:hypothetical protein
MQPNSLLIFRGPFGERPLNLWPLIIANVHYLIALYRIIPIFIADIFGANPQ